MIFETIVVGPLAVNCYLLSHGNGKAVLIDPGDDEERIRQALDRHRLTVSAVVNTHGHFDHIGCDDCFGAPVYIHRADACMLGDSRMNGSAFFTGPKKIKAKPVEVADGQMIEAAGISLRVIHTPGHSPGGICLELRAPLSPAAHAPGPGMVFTGDALFSGSIGRTDLVGGDERALLQALRRHILIMPDQTRLYPGHGPSTTVGREKQRNPFFQDE